ncbi:uncharacterized protein LOC129566003 isoform X2 [Sitodiplosis mosellana]|uniref:uncharacterized protein LOC129566003 isoform X2 n=1 Tax=Sitodiplosis mosellana TaxID=263140 RepID=UPI002443B572|nr:uncharacterized protein LOC129566003 isoform X2 [Sitodiplosis mosellana]
MTTEFIFITAKFMMSSVATQQLIVYIICCERSTQFYQRNFRQDHLIFFFIKHHRVMDLRPRDPKTHRAITLAEKKKSDWEREPTVFVDYTKYCVVVLDRLEDIESKNMLPTKCLDLDSSDNDYYHFVQGLQLSSKAKEESESGSESNDDSGTSNMESKTELELKSGSESNEFNHDIDKILCISKMVFYGLLCMLIVIIAIQILY